MHFDRATELNTGVDRRRLDPQADGREEGIAVLLHELDGVTDACRTLDADRRAFAKVDSDAEVRRQRRFDDLFLHLAVERDGDLAAQLAVADVDERVLLRELRERGIERTSLGRDSRHDDSLERRRCEVPRAGIAQRIAEPVPDPDISEAAKLRDLTGDGGRARNCGAVFEDADRRDLRGSPCAYLHVIAHPDRAGEYADVGDLLARRAALHFEHHGFFTESFFSTSTAQWKLVAPSSSRPVRIASIVCPPSRMSSSTSTARPRTLAGGFTRHATSAPRVSAP